MNILVITGIFPPDIGGPATYVPVISGELVKRGHQITVVTLSDALDHDDSEYLFSVRRIARGLFKPWRFLRTVAAIVRAGRVAQVLYVNGLYLEAVVANVLLRKRMVQKIVGDWAWERATNKGWVKDGFEHFQTHRYGFKIQMLKTLRAFCARRADAIIVPSRYLAGWIAAWKIRKKTLAVVYNAPEPVTGITSVQLPLPEQLKLKLITVGRLIPLKRVDRLIDAIAECDSIGLVIVGDGPERERLEQYVRRKDLQERIHFAGKRSKQETLSLIAVCDVFVLNSTHEGFPHVLLEAMTLGVPIIATAVGGTPEIVRGGENGILISANQQDSLSKALLDLSSVAARERLAKAARHTLKQFGHSTMVDRTAAVLQEPWDLQDSAPAVTRL
jgi:glycosyltransferase involved in cell wall biosynthesis